MAIVGKKFPSVSIDAMSDMGDDLKINVFEEAVNKNYMLSKLLYLSLKKEIQL
jgi:hypothetical protein